MSENIEYLVEDIEKFLQINEEEIEEDSLSLIYLNILTLLTLELSYMM